MTSLLDYGDFDRLFRIIQKHVNLKMDIIIEEDTEKRI